LPGRNMTGITRMVAELQAEKAALHPEEER
jgi:hypothetical protein